MDKTKQVAAVPRHVAIIMDGNNRWAKKRLLPGVAGHKAGVSAVRAVVKTCAEAGVASAKSRTADFLNIDHLVSTARNAQV